MATPYFLGTTLSSITFTAWDTDAAYPLTNLQTYYSADKWQSATTPDVDEFFVMDFGAASSCNTLIIHNHNLHALAGNVDLEAATDSGFTSGKITALDNIDSGATSLPIIKTFNAASKRYWRLSFNGVSAVPFIGNIFLGTRVDFDTTYDWDYSIGNKEYKTEVTESLDGRKRMSQVFTGKAVHSFSFNLQSETVKTNLRALLAVTRGGLYPLYFVDASGTSWLGRFTDDLVDIISHRYGVNNVSINFEGVEV